MVSPALGNNFLVCKCACAMFLVQDALSVVWCGRGKCPIWKLLPVQHSVFSGDRVNTCNWQLALVVWFLWVAFLFSLFVKYSEPDLIVIRIKYKNLKQIIQSVYQKPSF